jgi:hypothetical protein
VITATCGHTLTEEEDLGFPITVKSLSREGSRAVDYLTVCAKCREWWHTTDAVLEPGTENEWLFRGEKSLDSPVKSTNS